MATTTSKEVKISLKVMVHKEKNKVIFAEADSSFVDTLFSIMTLPMATIVRLSKKYSDGNSKALASLKTLHQGLVDFPTSYLSAEESKFMMLNPRTSSYDLRRKLKLNVDDTEPMKFFTCPNNYCNYYCKQFSLVNFVKCGCGNLMSRDNNYNVGVSGDDGGVFVPNLTTFIVTDDLCVKPNTSDVSIQLIRDLGFAACQLEERSIDIGRKEILILVNAALLYKYPLTYLVFHNVQPIEGSVSPKLGTLNLTGNEKDTNLKTMMLKLSLQKSTSKFLFAEAEEDFVDFLFGFLEIPLGTLIGKLMNGSTSSMCMNNLFASISNMDVGRWIKSQHLKDMLIQPMLEWKYVSANQLFPLNVSKSFSYSIYTLKDPRVEQRFLKSHGTKFMLTDDLVVTPLSSISVIAMLNKLKVPLIDVEQHAVSIGIEQGLKILMASLKSNTALTDALLGEILENKKRYGV
ncbi:hypothetical protein OSB04_015039 [Centaurea solstitialis]|uniref:DUF674 family protein n=1 Tax=Centaurea solstitialis TaxID=347529 RepID=A0AA38SY82_9ASTR|nr:hypothetical protein OSB04_015039 [Centaurea solstitialis]